MIKKVSLNRIPKQEKNREDRVTASEWNMIINILGVQTNYNSEAINRLITKVDKLKIPEKTDEVILGMIEFRTTETHLQWKYEEETDWKNVVELSGFQGEPVPDATVLFKFSDNAYVYFVLENYDLSWKVNRYDVDNDRKVATGSGPPPESIGQCEVLNYE